MKKKSGRASSYFDVPDDILVFDIGGIIRNNNGLQKLKIRSGVIYPLIIIYAIVALLFFDINNNKVIPILLVFILFLFSIGAKILKKILEEKYIKIIEKRYSVDLKNKDFVEFINKYYITIIKMQLTQKKEKEIIKNWKKEEVLKKNKKEFKKKGEIVDFEK